MDIKTLQSLCINDLTIRQQDIISSNASNANDWTENPFTSGTDHYEYWLECYSQSGEY